MQTPCSILSRSVSRLVLFVALNCTAGCASIDYTKYEKGAIWCNKPLEYAPGVHFDSRHLEVARRGYLYALAASWVLQSTNKEGKDHWFNLPPRMISKEAVPRDKSGFEVQTFEVREDASDSEPSEIVVAFTGSNDSDDWIFTNLLFSKTQYELARKYVIEVAERYQGKRLVVTGVSLGGGLAGHVAKDESTRKLVHEAWLFNPSPKLYANDSYDRRIWVGAMRGEMLHYVRNRFMEIVWPGINRIGAPWYQTADDYYLISSTFIYAHFRWVLARNILFVADYAHLQTPLGPIDQRRANEPREILENSKFKACGAEEAWMSRVSRRRAEQEAAAIQAFELQRAAELAENK